MRRGVLLAGIASCVALWYAGLLVIAGLSVVFEWRTGRWGSDGWDVPLAATFVLAAVLLLAGSGIQYWLGRWVPGSVNLAVSFVAVASGVGAAFARLLVVDDLTFAYLGAPLIGAGLQALLARFEPARA